MVEPVSGGVLALLAESGKPERVTPLGVDGMTAGKRAEVTLLRQLVRLLAGGTAVSGHAAASGSDVATSVCSVTRVTRWRATT